jgi:pheromone shutdown protein TraB
MRALIYFPVIHSGEDLGSLNHAVNNSRTEEQAIQYRLAVEHFWMMVEKTIEKLELNYTGLKLYQDGLPVCGKEKEIVQDVAVSGSKNYQLLEKLQDKGAVLMGTESHELLLQEYTLMRQLSFGQQSKSTLASAQALLEERDNYIAQRINETLQENEIAILFLGLMHSIEKKLPEDIVLIQPLGKPVGVN